MPHDLLLGKNTPAGGGPEMTDLSDLGKRIASLNAQHRESDALGVLRGVLNDPENGRIALVSSFGAEAVVLLHMVASINKSTPVIFIDTQMLFYETLMYQADLTEQLGLWNVRIIRADEHEIAARDPQGTLHQSNPDACCALRKTRPLNLALEGHDGWITGRKRFQAGSRAALEFFEADEASGRIKINPLAHWTPQDVRAYMEGNDLPKHPLISKGYPSIGCAPCTSKVAEGEDPRAGRWRGQEKTECGIHFADGAIVRKGIAA